MTGTDQIFASSLLALEMMRALRRERLDLARARMLDSRVTQVSIDDGILRSAAAIEPHVKSLDAIHLATCSLLGPGVTLVTHDVTMMRAAEQLGIATHDPLAE